MKQWQIVCLGLSMPLAVVIICTLGNLEELRRAEVRASGKSAPTEPVIAPETQAALTVQVASTLERVWTGPLPWFMAAMVGAFLLYFTPSLIAGVRKHHNATAIFMLNLFLGWTGMGWVGALVWAFTSPPPAPKTAP